MREINGQQYQLATMTVKLTSSGGEFPLKTFSRIRRRHAIGSDATTDAQGKRDGFTFGKEEAEVEFEIKFAEWRRLRAYLGTNSTTGAVAQCVFDLPISYGNREDSITTVTAVGCHVTEDATDSGDGATMVTVPVFVTTFDYGSDAPFIAYDD